MMQIDARILEALALEYGKKVEGGGYELSISLQTIAGIPPTGTLVEMSQGVPDNRCLRLRYYPNYMIEGEKVELEPEVPASEKVEEPPVLESPGETEDVSPE